MKVRLLRCKKSRGWLPNEYLTEIVGFCDKGFFRIRKEFTFPCTYTPTGQLLIDAIENLQIGEEEYDLSMIRCGNCGGEVEFVEEDADQILDRIRSKEVDMNVALQKRSRKEGESADEDDEDDED